MLAERTLARDAEMDAAAAQAALDKIVPDKGLGVRACVHVASGVCRQCVCGPVWTRGLTKLFVAVTAPNSINLRAHCCKLSK